MKLHISQPDVRSFLIVFFAFIGNAQVFGIDLVLVTIVPVLAIICLLRPPKIFKSNFGLLLFFSGVLTIVTFQTFYVDVPYFSAYGLWPLKALILMLLVATSPPPKWPTINMIALTLIVLALIAVGRFENGRFFSVFGPNMLYRLFGMLALFSAMQMIMSGRWKNSLRFVTFGLGIFGLMITGSSGAIVVFVMTVSFYLFHSSRRLFWAVMIGVCLVALVVPQQNFTLNFLLVERFDVVSRLVYKLELMQSDFGSIDRLSGALTFFTMPFAPLGHSHADFYYLWSFGYQYPHNIFSELYAFYGIFGVALIISVLIALSRLGRRILASDVYFLTFIILFIGSNFSGDLSDNHGVVGLAAGLLLRRKAQDKAFGAVSVNRPA